MQIHQYSATQIVAALKSGELKVGDVVHHQLERIRRINPQINAIVAINNVLDDPVAGELAGLPITVKDQIHYQGMACSFGSEKYKDFRPKTTAPALGRLLKAGAMVLGKTNLPPFAMDFQCSNSLFGVTNNPWNLQYTAGGSSGGSAAAVAAGLSFLDIGADLSGSLRIPASFCRVFSLLPSENAIPSEGMMAGGAKPLEHFARMGPIARSGEDLALAWKHMGGPSSASDPDFVMPDVHWSIDCAGIDLCDRIKRRFENATTTWANAGVNVVKGQPQDFDFQAARRAFGEIMGYETGELMPAAVRLMALAMGRPSARRSPEFLANVMLGYRHNRRSYEAAIMRKHDLAASIDTFLGDNSVWLLPVTAASTFKHMAPTSDRNGVRDYATPLEINGKPVNYFDALTSFATPISLTGHPVVTIPLGLDERGLPVGAQLIGKKGSEMHLIRTASELHARLDATVGPWE